MSNSNSNTPTKPKARKLTAYEQRAVQWCESIKQGCREHFTIEWKKSRTWGYNPRIAYGSENIVNISGCGYCKKSAALASALCWLFNPDTEKEAHNDVAGRAGCGESSVIDALAAHGWTLQCITGTDTTDVYRITRSEGR